MSLTDAERVIQLLKNSKDVTHLDLTGGAPELCPTFKYFVEGPFFHTIIGKKKNENDNYNYNVFIF